MPYVIPNVEEFYPGTYTAAPSSEYGEFFTGYRMPFGKIGSPTSIQTANQIKEVSDRLSEGTKLVELQPIQSEIFETIPKQQFAEVNQLMKLTGAKASMHAPMIDPAGFTERGGWNEYTRQESERHMMAAVEKAHLLDEKGSVPVVFHASIGIPDREWLGEKDSLTGKNKESMLYFVNRETGEWGPIKREVVASPIPFYKRDEYGKLEYGPDGHPIPDPRAVPKYETDSEGRIKHGKDGKPILSGYEVDPMLRLEEYNQRQATAPLSSIEYNKSIIEKNVGAYGQVATVLHRQKQLGEELTPEENERLQDAQMELGTVKNLLEDYDLDLRQHFHKAYTFSDKRGQEILREEMKKYEQNLRRIDELRKIDGKVMKEEEIIQRAPDQFAKIVDERSKAERVLIEGMRKVKPNIFVPTEEFALEKAKKTIGNVAFQAYKQFGEKAPILCIENFFPNTVFSRGESLKKLIAESQKSFVERAKQEGMNEDTARAMASKLIGATWDLGHINLIRKHGFGIEDGKFKPDKFAKAMAEESKAIAPFVKHVHLTDNFGYNDTHLPPGMGEVPFKEVLRELEKAGYSGRNIVEAGGFVAQKFGSPSSYVLEAFGSPIYGAAAAPYWNQAKMTYGFPQGYFSGYGTMLPDQHFNTYGSGFSSLPQELGGQMPGKGQRFSGAPME